MSWHFLQEEEEASWEASSLDGAPDALLKLMPTSAAFCSNASETGALSAFPSGAISAPSTAGHCGDRSISSPAGSPAKISAARAQDWGSTAPAQAFGSKCCGLFARWNPSSSSWKTPQCSLLEGLDEFSATWPRWGMMRTGVCWELSTPSFITAIRSSITSGKESGSLPTLCAADGEKGGRGDLYARLNNSGRQRKAATPGLEDELWPARFPTLLASDASGGPGHGKMMQGGPSLRTVIQMPTMRSRDWKDSGSLPPSRVARKNLDTLGQRLARDESDGGPLNPEWCEWFMGFPIGWTARGVSAMPSFQQWFRSFGKFCTDDI